MKSVINTIKYVILLGTLILHPSLNKGKNPITYLQYLVYGNSIDFSCDKSLDRNKVSVKWECEHQNLNCTELIIIKNGKTINNIPFKSGNQKLVVYYDSKIVGSLHHNKSISNQSHQYTINLTSKIDTISFEGKIAGPSSNYIPEVVELAVN